MAMAVCAVCTMRAWTYFISAACSDGLCCIASRNATAGYGVPRPTLDRVPPVEFAAQQLRRQQIPVLRRERLRPRAATNELQR